jgi:hypothetical protein
MPPSRLHWLTAQQAAVAMNTTSAEVCRLLALERLVGEKQKQLGRPGNGQWLIDPKSIVLEKRRAAQRAAGPAQRGRPSARLRPAKKPSKPRRKK